MSTINQKRKYGTAIIREIFLGVMCWYKALMASFDRTQISGFKLKPRLIRFNQERVTVSPQCVGGESAHRPLMYLAFLWLLAWPRAADWFPAPALGTLLELTDPSRERGRWTMKKGRAWSEVGSWPKRLGESNVSWGPCLPWGSLWHFFLVNY